MLPLPVSGSVLKSFGAPDGFGGLENGISIATRASAAVSSPTDGWIAFSGPYRTYGQLLIINGGGGYYVVLAGLSQVNVVVGQFVLCRRADRIDGRWIGPDGRRNCYWRHATRPLC